MALVDTSQPVCYSIGSALTFTFLTWFLLTSASFHELCGEQGTKGQMLAMCAVDVSEEGSECEEMALWGQAH
jgi:hypothetical protein